MASIPRAGTSQATSTALLNTGIASVRSIALAFLLTAGWVAVAIADEASDGTSTAAATPAGAPAALETDADTTAESGPPVLASGLRAFVDPVSGEILEQPTPEQEAALATAVGGALSRSGEGLVPFELAGGGVGLHLRGRFRHAVIAHRLADGSFELVCPESPEDAAALLARSPDDRAEEPRWEEK